MVWLNKKGNVPSKGPSPAYILLENQFFTKQTIWTDLDMFHVETRANLVDTEDRKMEPPSYRLWGLPSVKEGYYLGVPCVMG